MWVGNDSANRWVFKCLRKTQRVRAEVMFCGKLFHTAGPATAKALVPTLDSLAGGATDSWWQQSAGFVDLAGQQREQVGRGMWEQFHEALCTSA